jgi:putative RNA 2'-phosphotransferase
VVDVVELSRTISHALRHEPWLYELELDDEGWVPVEDLIQALRTEKAEWASITATEIAKVIAHSDKKRHELRDGRIGKLLKEAAAPPTLLYHGTSPQSAGIVRSEGLRPMSRHHVHLSVDIDTARRVGMRKAKQPVILTVKAREAHEHGVQFYRGNDRVWLADQVPPEFVSPESP